jgi:hypothetical protein
VCQSGITFNSLRLVERTTKLVGLFGNASSTPGPDASNSNGAELALLGLVGENFEGLLGDGVGAVPDTLLAADTPLGRIVRGSLDASDIWHECGLQSSPQAVPIGTTTLFQFIMVTVYK